MAPAGRRSIRDERIEPGHHAILLDLNRFRLYEALQMEVTRSAATERTSNSDLLDMVNGSAGFNTTYRKAFAPTPAVENVFAVDPDQEGLAEPEA
jgi:hypothetical protein